MKVLIVNSTNNIISGAEFAILDMIKSCDDSIEFEIVTPGTGKLTKFFEKSGIKVHSLKMSTIRRKYPFLHVLSSLNLALFFKKNKFDMILCNTFAASVRVSLAAKILKIPLAICQRIFF